MGKIENKNLERYHLLLDAIDFFTQRFHIHQIMLYSMQFSKQLLQLDKVSLFISKNGKYHLVEKEGYEEENLELDSTKKLEELPLFYGRVIVDSFEEYFPEEFISKFDIGIVIPLINDTQLVGFIVSNGKVQKDELSKDDYLLLDILMKLMNVSIENNHRLLDFQKVKGELDRKLFDLFVINQSTKALLSELNIEKLHNIATDVFSEISGSKVTTFGIYDDITNKMKLVGYRDVYSFNSFYTEFELLNKQYNSSKIVLHIEKDRLLLDQIFKNTEQFNQVNCQYIVLLVRGDIIGFVTLGESRSGKPYESAVFELIETLASSTYIALHNAQLFREVSLQKNEVQKKYSMLSMFNRLSRTINSCESLEELYSLSLQTLQLGFGIEKAFFAIGDKHGFYKMTDSVGIELEQGLFKVSANVLLDDEEDIFVRYQQEDLSNYFMDAPFINKVDEHNALVIASVSFKTSRIDDVDLEEKRLLLVVLASRANLKEEEILIIDTLTKNLKPILSRMYVLEKQISEKELFVRSLTNAIDESIQPNDNVFVYWKKLSSSPFEEIDRSLILSNFAPVDKVYIFNQHAFVISDIQYQHNENEWNVIENPSSINDLILMF